MHEFKRTDRIASQMQRELAELVHDEVKDPRLGMITIQAVRVTSDLAHAKVFFTVLDVNKDVKQVTKVLNGAVKGFLRRQLGQRMRLRIVPELEFVYDTSIENGAHLSELIDRAVESDRHHH